MAAELAINGGTPVRRSMLPYAHQTISAADVEAVISVLKSPWLTTGPAVDAFESAFAARVHANDAVAVSSGTAALHAAMHTLALRGGDEVIVPALTFVASANAAVYVGAHPVFADVDPETLLLEVESAERVASARARAVVSVDYAGQPCDYDLLREFTEDRGLDLVIDACHSLGASWGGRPSSVHGRLSAFSFHPVKHITTGEGGMVATDSPADAASLRAFRNHGIDKDSRARGASGSWEYAMTDLGYNYRLTDMQCALGVAQLARLDEWLKRRREIAVQYLEGIACIGGVRPPAVSAKAEHSWHLFVVQLQLERLRVDRNVVFDALRAEGIGVNVHYMPVHLHPFYQRRYGTCAGMCPNAEAAYERILSLPMFAGMTDSDVADVLTAVDKVLGAYRR